MSIQNAIQNRNKQIQPACANPECTNTITRQGRGRLKRFCSAGCRLRVSRGRTISTHGRQDFPGPVNDSGVVNSEQNISTISTACRGENGDLQKPSLRWIELNDCTWKLTDGATERTPASHGQWGGFNIERGVAWVAEVGKPFKQVAWYARCGDSSYGPTKLETAKQAAMAFARGAKSFPKIGIASSFTGEINLHADPEVAAAMRRDTA
jgi:hypothetical protein